MEAIQNRRKVLGIAVVLIICCWITARAVTVLVADDYNRPDSTSLGSTPTGGISYEEFNASGGLLVPDDIAQIEAGRIRFGGFFSGSPTDPAEARLAGIGFDLDVTAEVRFLADDYDPNAVVNAVIYAFHQGMNPAGDSIFTKGYVQLIVNPEGTYFLSAVTESGNLVFGPSPVSQVLANRLPIGPAFLLTDTDGDGILESNEPFTLRAKTVGNVFCWFMNGVQIGEPVILPDGAITGVDPSIASNFFFGRTRSVGGPGEIEVAFDDLSIQAPEGPCPTPTLEVSIDIKPGSNVNSINPRSNGVIPVAILTTDAFDASTVDATTVRFGPNEAAAVQSALEDVDGDGDLDLILHFRTQQTGIQCGDTSASLTGQTTGGQAIAGSNSVTTVGCK